MSGIHVVRRHTTANRYMYIIHKVQMQSCKCSLHSDASTVCWNKLTRRESNLVPHSSELCVLTIQPTRAAQKSKAPSVSQSSVVRSLEEHLSKKKDSGLRCGRLQCVAETPNYMYLITCVSLSHKVHQVI